MNGGARIKISFLRSEKMETININSDISSVKSESRPLRVAWFSGG